MEDLREEPELEEREEEEHKEQEEHEEEEVEEEESDDKSTCNNSESQMLMKPPTPVRSAMGRDSNKKIDANWLNSTFKKPLLETNFSITGINEIKTQQIPMTIDKNTKNNCLPTRPQSLCLQNSSPNFKTRPESIHVDKADIKLLDISNFQ